jgi:hypothetical protein
MAHSGYATVAKRLASHESRAMTRLSCSRRQAGQGSDQIAGDGATFTIGALIVAYVLG